MTEANPEVQSEAERKPRLALMGEFSAGKSTLANALMGEAMSPTQITATQVPPIWYAHGDRSAFVEMQDGTERPLTGGFETLDLSEDIRAVRVFSRCEILEACDIIDMPGSSDPNMSADLWQNMLPLADGVLWCTPATQAWRQSEAAIWEGVPSQLWPRSLLLLTRIDKITSQQDRDKIVRRVHGEAGAFFREILPVSLLEATKAGSNPEAWNASGAARVIDGLLEIVTEVARSLDPSGTFDTLPLASKMSPARKVELVSSQAELRPLKEDPGHAESQASRVIPRRVVKAVGAGSSRARPRRASHRESVI